MDKNKLKQDLIDRYGETNETIHTFFSPGRVNLIGEHTDYNGGYVFPCAISYGTYLAIRKNNTNLINFASKNFPKTSTLRLDDLFSKKDNEWINYPLGVINQLVNKGFKPEGIDLLFYGDIPNGAGLSSSASIELVTAYALTTLFSLGISLLDMVKLSQKAENLFVGVNCGIMDQFAVGFGEKNKAIFLNCDTLDYELVPVDIKGYKLIISNTNKRRGLSDSKYNERRSECDKAVSFINRSKSISNLSDISLEEFHQLEEKIPDKTIRKRARHVITENHRVLEAVNELKKGNLIKFGELMNQSHESLRMDYEVTGFELDTLVDEAYKIPGVIGSRMTGAGFGGCTVSLVKEDAVNLFISEVGKNYQKETGTKADFYIADIGNGVTELK